METHELFIQIAGILIAARVFAEIAAHFNAPRVIGEMCAEIIVVIAYTTLFSPFWIRLYYRLYGNRFPKENDPPER